MDETRIVTAIAARPTDSFQIALKNLLDGETEIFFSSANDTTDVEDQRRRLVRHLFDGAEHVDLVGHSTPINRYLRLGNWVLDPTEAARLASYMPASVNSVSLIGCATASTPAGREAAEAIARSGRYAAGTLHKVYTTHFDKKGVKKPGNGGPGLKAFLPRRAPERPSLPPARPAAPSSSPPAAKTFAPGVVNAHHAHLTVPRRLAWLGRCTWSVIAVPFAVLCWLFRRLLPAQKVPYRQILWLLSPRSTPMPGLLTEPLLTFEITSGRKLWTLEILFDFEYARFYSSAAKRDHVYKIRRGFARVTKTLLEKYLEWAPHGVALRNRHVEAGNRGGELKPARGP